MKLQLKRVYEASAKTDGMRILVDRLWPRGLTKEKAKIDLWLKEIAPSTALRQWFAHDPNKWTEFKKKYRVELKERQEELVLLKKHLQEGVVTLVYGAKDELHNDAVALKEYLEEH